MKLFITLLTLGAYPALTMANDSVSFLRQHQQATGVIWDRPAVTTDDTPFPAATERASTFFQLWRIDRSRPEEHLVDQKLVGAYLPEANIRIKTLDPYKPTPRTRVDQPFSVEINLAGLLAASDFPRSSSSVLLQRLLKPGLAESKESLHSRAYLDSNGSTNLRFLASSLTAEDPTKASGVERFVIHSLAGTDQTQIAAASIRVFPVASGAIRGIAPGETLRHALNPLQLTLEDLYPSSTTYLYLFNGTQVAGAQGTLITEFRVDQESCKSQVLDVLGIGSHLSKNGTYTLALFSDTVFGRELLCDSVTFSIDRDTQPTAATAKR